MLLRVRFTISAKNDQNCHLFRRRKLQRGFKFKDASAGIFWMLLKPNANGYAAAAVQFLPSLH